MLELKPSDENLYLVGHSMGCQAIARYLETLSGDVKIRGAVFVAGFFKRLTNIGTDENSQETEKHWLGTPIDFKKVRLHLPQSAAIFSDNDPYVPLENQEEFRDELGSEIFVLENQGHFSGPGDNCMAIPLVKELLVKMIRK